ncbi:glycosyltransferase family 2 protein [Candidatus Electrothrix sp.]|uniref:glycosyltransferase family 2 protein n=1 Tax=Candidatus Electrothrix sp. TaxID=2170559 RepID=UPI0040570C4A
MLKISIITVSFNSEKYIGQTILTVVNQNYKNIEYIIIDGASTDGTLNIIEKYKNKIDYFVSEPDNGISDAMNKGLEAATGDYILFLHSDDYLVDENALEAAVQHIVKDHDIFQFNIYFSDKGVKTLTRARGLNWWMNFKTGVLHQSVLCSKVLFKKIGGFDTRYKITMDYDFFLRAYRAETKFKQIDLPLSVMRKTGISSRLDWPNLKKRLSEEKEIHKKNCNSLLLKIIYNFYWPIYQLYRYLRA